jgi:hypothetical protein
MDGRAHSGARSSRVLRRALWGALCAGVFLGSSPVPSRDPRAAFAMPPIESLEGCLQLRYAVQAALARHDFEIERNQPPGI